MKRKKQPPRESQAGRVLTAGVLGLGMNNPNPSRVLVVEDDKDSAAALATLLRAIGYTVEVVLAATDAILRLHTFAPHIVLLDVAMPIINGYELARAIRAEPGFESIPLVVLSGYGDDAHRLQSIAEGISHHLVKPVPFEELQEVLVDELAGPRPSA